MTKRPAEFDRQIAAAYPRLLNYAAKYHKDDPTSLANQAVVRAMSHWDTFRQTPGDAYRGFYTWLVWCLRSSASNYAKVKKPVLTDRTPVIAVPADQESKVDLDRVLSMMSGPADEILLRRAKGETSVEIGAELGLSGSRVRQIEDKARARLLERLGMDDERKAA